MFNKFTDKSQEVIINSQIIATDYGQSNIEAVHILLALLEQSESLIKPILEKMKIDPEVIEDYTIKEIGKLPRVKVNPNVGPIQAGSGTAETAVILERAQKEADGMNDDFISTEHILLALIGVASPAQKILLNFKRRYILLKN